MMVSAVSSLPLDLGEDCHVEMVDKCYLNPGADCGGAQPVILDDRLHHSNPHRGKRQAIEECPAGVTIVRKCDLLWEDKCYDLPHMECEGEGEEKECENVLKPVCWPVSREDPDSCVDEEVCTWVDDGVVPEVEIPEINYSVRNVGPIEEYEHPVPAGCTAVWLQVCRKVPQATNCEGHTTS